MIKSTILVILALLLLAGAFASGLPPVRAAEDAIAEPSTPSASTTSQLKKRLERILGDQDGGNSPSGIAGYMGEVTRVNEDALAVKTHISNHIIPLDETISIIRNNRPIPVEDISVGTWVLAIGNRVKNGDVSPKTIVALTTPPKQRDQFVAMGIIKEVSRNTIIFIPRGQTEPVTLLSNRNSKLIDANGETLTLADLPTDVSVIVVGFLEPTGNPWSLSTLKTMVNMEDFKGSPTPTPVVRPRSASPSATLAPVQ